MRGCGLDDEASLRGRQERAAAHDGCLAAKSHSRAYCRVDGGRLEIADNDIPELEFERLRGLGLRRAERDANADRVDDGDLTQVWVYLGENLECLAGELDHLRREPGHIATRMRKIGGEAGGDRIAAAGPDDGNGVSGLPSPARGLGSAGRDD